MIVYGIITIYVVLFVIFSITNYTIVSGEVMFTILVSGLLIVGKLENKRKNLYRITLYQRKMDV